MNRRNIIIASVVLILLIIGGAAFWYFSQRTPTTGNDGQFPGGSTGTTGGVQTGTDTGTGEGPDLATLPRLYELHKVAVAGIGIAETKDKKGVVTSVYTRYAERGLGHIYETNLSNYKEARIVNETRSRISEALWGNNGNSVVFRFLDEKSNNSIRTSVINIEVRNSNLPQNTSLEDTAAAFLKTNEVNLPDNIPFMSKVGDESDRLFFLEAGLSASIGTSATFKNTDSLKIFSSSFTEWLPQFPNQKLITLTTKPSAEVAGHMFFLDTKTKVATKVIGAINGLTTLTSPNGKMVLYSETKTTGPELSLYDVDKKKTYSLYVKTLPEKCVWGKKTSSIIYCGVPQKISTGIYPDQWYQGVISFSDELWSIDTTNMTPSKILVPSTLSAPALDIINPVLSSDDTYLLFMNKITSTPWLYNIVEHTPPAVTTATPTFNTSSVTTPVPESAITSDMQKLK